MTGKDGKSYPARRLKLEPLIAARARVNLATAEVGVRGGASPLPKSAKSIDTREELAKIRLSDDGGFSRAGGEN